ncbi:MAG TPA: ABC transporter permease [Thermoanaerobaculia bacterium]
MRSLRAFLARLRGSFPGGKRARELTEELESHIALDVDEKVRSGMDETEARRQAILRLGGLDATAERWRDRRGFPLLQELRQDLRGAARAIARHPGFAALTVAMLAVGIGGATAIFTIVHGVLIARLPFRDADRLVVLWEENADRPGRRNTVGPANFIRWTERATSFSKMTALYDTRVSLAGRARPEQLVAQYVTAGFFATLGVAPMIGRGFAPDEGPDGHDAVAVLSWGVWQRLFGGDPAIVGKPIQVNGRPVEVIGVAPRDFNFYLKSGSLVGKAPDLWMPMAFDPDTTVDPRGRYVSAFARLKDGVSIAEAGRELGAIAARLAVEWPRLDAGWTARVFPIRDEVSGDLRPALLVLSGAVGFVLVIVCVNVANLLLARGLARRQEIAIRTALGAGRFRVVRQLLTETLLLALLGGAAGWGIARAAVVVLLAKSPVDPTVLSRVRLSLPVLLFSVVAVVVTAVVSGIVPAIESVRGAVGEALQESTRSPTGGERARRIRQGLVVAEVALAAVLLVGAGLLLRSFGRLSRIDPGFDSEGLFTGRVILHGAAYKDDEKVLAFFRDVTARARAIPGVRAAGMVSFLPFAGLGAATDFTVVGEPQPPAGRAPVTDVRVCDNGFFQAMRIPLVQGRLFDEREMRTRSNVVIVSEAFARKAFPRGGALGRRVTIEMAHVAEEKPAPTEVIGIVGDVKVETLTAATRPMAYWPHPQLPYSGMTFVLRSDDPSVLAGPLRAAVAESDKDQPLGDARPMEDWIGVSLTGARFSAMLLATFAAIALLLAAAGIYGVMSYVVGQRRSEIGIRMALGAPAESIRRMMVAGGARLVLLGLAIGMPLALALSSVLSSLLFETSGRDPATLAGVIATLGVSAVAASYGPAWRASRIEPAESLRNSF